MSPLRRSLAMFAVLLLPAVSGCLAGVTEWISSPVRSQVATTQPAQAVDIRDMKKVAIFPFADYTQMQPYEFAPNMAVNQRVLDEVADHFVQHGVEVSVQEDVNSLLLSQGAMVVLKRKSDPSTIDAELKTAHHSPVMQKNMANIIVDDKVWSQGKSSGPGMEGFTAGLSPKMLQKIGAELGADKVLRGRIIDYAILKTKSLNPANGIIGVGLGGILEGMGAFAYQDSYEAGLPPATIMSSDLYGDRIQWTAGMGIPPQQNMSDVQIRLYLQDVATGKVLWTNRAHVSYSPASKLDFVDNQPQRMLDKAVKAAVDGMMADLFKAKL